MSRGRPRKPDGLKVLQGTFRKSRRNPRQMTPELGEPEHVAPLTDAEAAVWTRVVAVLPSGVLTKADGFVLDLFARCYAEFLAVDAAVKESGRIIVTRDDTGTVTAIRMNPNVRLRAVLVAELRRLGGELGLTPATRSKVNATNAVAAAADPFGTLLGLGGILGGRGPERS